MKISFFSAALFLPACAIVFSALAIAEDPKPRARGGFDRPLADSNRFGNPGASPKLAIADLRAFLAHWAEFDANKNGKLEKDEVPELFGKLFDEADLNHDGALDEQERALVLQPASTTSAAPVSTTAK
jgi:hypothetical protein